MVFNNFVNFSLDKTDPIIIEYWLISKSNKAVEKQINLLAHNILIYKNELGKKILEKNKFFSNKINKLSKIMDLVESQQTFFYKNAKCMEIGIPKI